MKEMRDGVTIYHIEVSNGVAKYRAFVHVSEEQLYSMRATDLLGYKGAKNNERQ